MSEIEMIAMAVTLAIQWLIANWVALVAVIALVFAASAHFAAKAAHDAAILAYIRR